jgi:hypothetical protein
MENKQEGLTGDGWHRQELPVAAGREVFIKEVLSEHKLSVRAPTVSADFVQVS